MEKICQNCGNELNEKAKFCPKCGVKYKVPMGSERSCKSCGHSLNKNMKFCPKCGQAVDPISSIDTQKPIDKIAETIKESATQFRESISPEVDKGEDLINGYKKIPDAKKEPKKKIFKIVILLFVILFIITRFIGNEPKEEYILNAARNVVSKNLVAPATAIYSNEKILEKDDYGRYLVYITVDAENGYGGMVRSEWSVIVFSVTKKDFHYNNQASYVNSYSGVDVQSEIALDTLKEFNDWDKPLEE